MVSESATYGNVGVSVTVIVSLSMTEAGAGATDKELNETLPVHEFSSVATIVNEKFPACVGLPGQESANKGEAWRQSARLQPRNYAHPT